ncbi:MAG: desulfoferrodoxin family protein [Treponema sp.]
MMNNELKFFTTAKGGTFLGLNACDEAAVVCGDQKIAPVKVGSVDAAKEKHVPVVEVNGQTVTVKVGSVMHPMSAEHHIAWVCLRTKQGIQLKELPLDKEPVVEFSLTADDSVIEAFEFCNLHGVWVGK